MDTALTVKTPEKLGFYSGPRRSIETQSLWSSICRITMRTKRLIFLWKKVGDMFVDGNVCFFLSVNVDDDRWRVSKMTCSTCGRNQGKCRFGTSKATHVLTKCTGDALSVKLSGERVTRLAAQHVCPPVRLKSFAAGASLAVTRTQKFWLTWNLGGSTLTARFWGEPTYAPMKMRSTATHMQTTSRRCWRDR